MTPNYPSPLRALAVLWRLLAPAQRRRFVLLQVLSLLMALSTLLGLAAVMTFLAVLADPGIVHTHAALDFVVGLLPRSAHGSYLPWLSGAFVALLGLGALLNIAGTLAAGRFAYAVGDRIRTTLFAGYLQRDYLFHLRTGAATLSDQVLYQSDRVTIALVNGQLLITNATLTLLVVASIAIVNLAMALGGAAVVGGCYLLVYHLMRKRVSRNGRLLTHHGVERFTVVERALYGIKYLLVARAQPAFARRFAEVTRAMSRAAADTQFIGQFPRYLLEFLAGAALIACAGFAGSGVADTAWLAQLSFVAFAGFRLLPAIQQMYAAFVAVRSNVHALDRLAEELEGLPVPPSNPARSPELQLSIELRDVDFGYAPAKPPILDHVSLRIEAGAAVGIVGASGCGKTTLLDLVLGLLAPQSGRVEVDGEAVSSRWLQDWQKKIGFVPQEVMILDATVRENVAFGVEPARIDDARVYEVIRQAEATEFVDALPGGIHAMLGGTLGGLSQGQRQRLGIARALYGDPVLLVLDEGTNSLDAATELAVIDSVIRRRGGRTVLLAAHGGAAIDACDRILEMRGGKLLEIGAGVARREPSRVAQAMVR